jgi:hypothetical protein
MYFQSNCKIIFVGVGGNFQFCWQSTNYWALKLMNVYRLLMKPAINLARTDRETPQNFKSNI